MTQFQTDRNLSSVSTGFQERRFTKKDPCPICSGHQACKQTNYGILCFKGETDTDNWIKGKPLSNGMGHYYFPRRDGRQSYNQTYNKLPDRAVAPKTPPLGDEQRNKEYRRVLAESLTALNNRHKTKLLERGLTDTQIQYLESVGFRSNQPGVRLFGVSDRLPGTKHTKSGLTNASFRQLTGGNGFLIPALDPMGSILGFQIAPDQGDAKYRWLSSEKSPVARTNGELPLFVAMPPLPKRRQYKLPKATLYIATERKTVSAVLYDAIGNMVASSSKEFSNRPDPLDSLLLGLQLATIHGVNILTIATENTGVATVSLGSRPIGLAVESLLSQFPDATWQQVDAAYNLARFINQSEHGTEGTVDYRRVILCDGALKAYLTAIRHSCVTIGAPGGLHGSCPKSIEKYLEQLQPELVIHAPDAGDVVNTAQVPGVNMATHKLIEKLGYDLAIAWWGQTEKSAQDIDEIESLDAVELITPQEFFSLHPQPIQDRLLNRETYRRGFHECEVLPEQPHPIVERSVIRYESQQRVDAWSSIATQSKFILDTSHCGSGKSTTVAKMEPWELKIGLKQLIHVSAKSMTTDSHWNFWGQYRGRDQGRNITQSGSVEKFYAATANGALPQIEANCIKGEENDNRLAKGLSADYGTLCLTCPALNDCTSNPYHYLFDKFRVLRDRRYRTTVNALFPESFLDSNGKTFGANKKGEKQPGTGIILDDIQSFFVGRQIELGDLEAIFLEEDIQPQLDSAPKLKAHLRTLLSLLKKTERIVSPKQFIDLFGTDVELDENAYAIADSISSLLESDSADFITRQWLATYLDCLTGKIRSVFQIKDGKLGITSVNQELIDAITHPAVAVVLILDATLSADVLESLLRDHLDGQPIPVLAVEEPTETANVVYKQIVGAGDLGYTRTEKQLKIANRVKEFFSAKHTNGCVIDIKKNLTDQKDGTIKLGWLSESRGSNAAKSSDALLAIGTPRQNIGSVQAEYMLLTGNYDVDTTTVMRSYPVQSADGKTYTRTMKDYTDPGLSKYAHQKIQSEFIQGAHRLRGHIRPGENLSVYFLTEYPLPFDVQVEHINDTLGMADAITELDDSIIRSAVWIASEDGTKITQGRVCDLLGITRSKLRYWLSANAYDWKLFVTQSMALLQLEIDAAERAGGQSQKTAETPEKPCTSGMATNYIYNSESPPKPKCRVSGDCSDRQSATANDTQPNKFPIDSKLQPGDRVEIWIQDGWLRGTVYNYYATPAGRTDPYWVEWEDGWSWGVQEDDVTVIKRRES